MGDSNDERSDAGSPVIVTLAWKTLLSHPVRTAVLGIGFGLGVGVMATLLGVGEVVLEQARTPALVGGGQLVASGAGGALTSGRFAIETLKRQRADVVASPRRRADLFLVRGGHTVPIAARGGIPSLERALGDPETSRVAAWTDTAADTAWSSPDASAVLRAMDRFHAQPAVASRASSWAEWLYFKGISGQEGQDARDRIQIYCTFLFGPKRADGRRVAGVRLQLDRGGEVQAFGDSDAIDEASVVATAPDVAIGRSRVTLEGSRYHLMLDLPDAAGSTRRVRGDLFVDAVPGRSLPPFVMRGAGGWLSGYTVPVMAGPLTGSLTIAGRETAISGTGYHDHNWGFWEGVTWRWGQVQHDGLSFVYGRVYPPADAADAERVPGFLAAFGPDGPIGYSTRVTIDETNDRIIVQGHGSSLDVRLDLAVERAIVHRGGPIAGGPDFLQLRARYHVTGRAGAQSVDFTASGAAETFRGR